MRENEGVPDIEKLGHEEFDLDVEEQMRLQAQGDEKVQKVSSKLGHKGLRSGQLQIRSYRFTIRSAQN